MVYTDLLQLHKWEPNDLVDLNQINANTQKLDEVVGGLQFFAIGTYTGNGKSGAEYPSRLSLAQRPRLLIILGGNTVGLLAPAEETGIVRYGSSINLLKVTYSETDAAVFWYGSSSQLQLNANGAAYGYAALG